MRTQKLRRLATDILILRVHILSAFIDQLL